MFTNGEFCQAQYRTQYKTQNLFQVYTFKCNPKYFILMMHEGGIPTVCIWCGRNKCFLIKTNIVLGLKHGEAVQYDKLYGIGSTEQDV